MTFQLLWGGLYAWRTSFNARGEHVYCLWDDSMIAMQYARNLAQGHGLVWMAGGERVQGFTDIGPTLVMALIHLLPLPDTRTSLAWQVLQVLVLTSLPLLAFRVARRAFGGSDAAAVGAALATLAFTPLGTWTVQGSDVGMVAAWLLGCLALLPEPGLAPGPLFWVVLCSGLLLRPDDLLAAGVLVAAQWPSSRARTRLLLTAGLVLGATLGAYLAFGWWYYGDPLPNTWYLKGTGQPKALMIATGLSQLRDVGLPLVPAAAVGLAGAWLARKSHVATACAAIVVLLHAWSVWIGGDWAWQVGWRYAAPALAVLAVLLGGACALALGKLVPSPTSSAVLAAGLAVALAFASNPASGVRDWFNPAATTAYERENVINFTYARYFRDVTEPSTLLGMHWAGVIPYFSDRPAVDVLGKCDRHLARIRVDRFSPGHSKWDWDYTLTVQRPDIMEIATRGLDERDDFRSEFWLVHAPHRMYFYLRKSAVGKVHDRALILEDQVTHALTAIGLAPGGP